MQKNEGTEGLVAAPHTPIAADGSVAFGEIERQIEVLVAQKVVGAFICGTTGEGLSLTSRDRKVIVERWCQHAPSELKVIVHVGHHSAAEAADLAAHAAENRAHGISTMAPSFLKPETVDDLVAFCEPIAAAAPELPFYFYNIPSLSGVSLPMVPFLERGSERIPNLAGIKYTHGDLMEFQQCRAAQDGRFDILWGLDEELIGALAVGARGAVGSTYNYAATLYYRMIDAFRAGDLSTAQDCALDSVRLVEQLKEFGTLPGGKALMSLHGVDCGDPLPPVASLAPEKKRELLERVRGLGIIESVAEEAVAGT